LSRRINGQQGLIFLHKVRQGLAVASTEVTPYLVKAESEQRSYIVIFTIEDGPQYRIGEMQVRDATVFAPTELREQIPLKPGEVFDEDKIWQGIESITRLYGAKGYIDMTAGLTAGIDESKGLINASVEVREGTQYRVGTVKILGLGRNTESLLKSLWEPGQVFPWVCNALFIVTALSPFAQSVSGSSMHSEDWAHVRRDPSASFAVC
jgi:outer membrane protein assembly factor BamA